MDKAILWAGKAGLKVWIDLHGAPGSQNGFDNSGRRDHVEWQTRFNVPFTVEVIRTLARKYSHPDYKNIVVAIELLNEPTGFILNMDIVRQYWYDGFGTVRDYGSLGVVIHDSFQPVLSWNGFMTKGFNNIFLDTHSYQVFVPEDIVRSLQEHISAACGLGVLLQQTDKWTVVGEWSAARTDCADHLNGVGRGSRWEGSIPIGYGPLGSCEGLSSGTVANYSIKQKVESRKFIEAQLDSFEQGAGWFFWTWKTEGAPDWDMRDLLENGLFPQPLSTRKCMRKIL